MIATIVAFVLLVFVSSAWAEGARVLWVTADTEGGNLKEHTKPIGFYDTPTKCEDVARERRDASYKDSVRFSQMLNDYLKSPDIRRVERTEYGHVIRRYNRVTGEPVGWNMYEYLCMADTVDPREPQANPDDPSPGTSDTSRSLTGLKLSAEHADRAGEVWARRGIDLKEDAR